MTNHTPGPWSVRFELGTFCIRPNSNTQKGHSFGYAPIAKVVGDKRIGSQHENARLIAAAPELLEALVKALPEISVCATADILEQARSAIAKATGETK